jgi:glycosyltransferase involved in cell wall biosynthesis
VPRVSVLMPVRNAAQYVAEAAGSILGQTLADLELLVLDDASEDGSAAVVASLGDPRARVVRGDGPGGVALALNRLLGEASAPYVARMDADDVAHPERLARQVAYLDAHPEVAAVGTAGELVDHAGARVALLELPADPAVLGWELLFENVIVHPSVTMRRQAVELAGRYPTDAPHAEDYALWLRLAADARLANLPDVLMSIRQHPDQASVRFTSEQRHSADRLRGEALSVALGRAVDPRLAAWWGQLARREPLPSPAAVRAVAALLLDALAAYQRRWRLAGSDVRAVRRRAARRLLALARVNARRAPTALPLLLLRALALSPDALRRGPGALTRRATIAP